MSTKIDPISTIIASFPVPELSKLGDTTTKPSYHSLLTVQKELNTNAASIDTTHGTGIHGLLVLTMSATEFDDMINPPNDNDDDDFQTCPNRLRYRHHSPNHDPPLDHIR